MDSNFNYGKAAEEIARPNVAFIDVRTPEEFASGHPEGAENIPIDTINESTADSLREKEAVYVICGSGMRSAKACEALNELNIETINIPGGLSAWQEAGLPVTYEA